MAFEPVTAPTDGSDDEDRELRDMTRRFWVGVALSLPVLILAMGRQVPGWAVEGWILQTTTRWVEFVLATSVVLWCGWPFFQRGYWSIVGWRPNMFTLISVGVAASWIYSVVATLTPEIFPDAFRDASGEVGVYFEAAAVIVTLVLLGQVLELRARRRTRGAIRALLDPVAHTARRIDEARRSRAPIQHTTGVAARFFVPGVLLISVVTFAIWSVWGPEPAMAYAIVNAVAVLIIACPRAIGLATSMSIMVGVGRAAREGVFIRDAEALEVLEKIDTVVVDKTGTLTEGRPSLVVVEPMNGRDEGSLLRAAASLERGSEHPLANAIVRGAADREIELAVVQDFESQTGRGVSGTVDGRIVSLGNRAMMKSAHVEADSMEKRAEGLRFDGQTVVFVSIDGEPAGLLGVADPIKKSTPDAVQQLHESGVEIVMLTGDSRTTAEAVAKTLGIDQVEAEVLPQEKAKVVQALQSSGRRVAMAGDGIKDAAGLAQADVGIAMGAGTDVAIEPAGITLVRGDLREIARSRQLSRATMRNIRQNLFFAFAYNVAGVPVAAGILYPVSGVLLSPIFAAAAMTFSSVLVIGNALRLQRVRL